MERRVIIAFLMSMLFLSLYNALVIKPRLESKKRLQGQRVVSTDTRKLKSLSSFPQQLLEQLKEAKYEPQQVKTELGWVEISPMGIHKVVQNIPYAASPVNLSFELPVLAMFNKNIKKTFNIKGVKGNVIEVQLELADVAEWVVGPQLPHVKDLPARYAKYYEGIILRSSSGKVRRVPVHKLRGNIKGEFKGIGLYSKYYISYVSLLNGVIREVKILNSDKTVGLLMLVSGGPKIKMMFYGGLGRKEYIKALPEAKAILRSSWFSGITDILWIALKFCYRLTHNWGLAIILLAVLFSLVFMPLTMKSYAAVKKMQAIQPELKALQEKYKDDPQKLNQELLMLYAKHGVNPFSGCLPILIQLPVFFSLYPLLLNTYEFKYARFLWIKDLSLPDAAFRIGDFQVNLLPLIVVILMSLQQRLSIARTNAQQQNQAMLWIFPIIFLLIFYSMPSGVVLFWLVLSMMNFAQQYYYMNI